LAKSASRIAPSQVPGLSGWLAVGLGSGLAPKAPGTWGTLAALPLVWWLAESVSYALFIGLTLAAFLLGIYVCGMASRAWQAEDHPAIVWDEWVGLAVTVAFLPELTWHTMLAAFVAFRFFDILKPWPISWLDAQVKGGLGIMLDDLVAGLMAGGCVWFIYLLV
jgi:phosphatidylglycerophosphatase A